jgi:hypothetical protein
MFLVTFKAYLSNLLLLYSYKNKKLYKPAGSIENMENKALKSILPLQLKRPVTGIEIATALRAVSAKYGEIEKIGWGHKKVYDDSVPKDSWEAIIWGIVQKGVILGFASPWEYMKFVVGTGKDYVNEVIQPHTVYERVALKRSDTMKMSDTGALPYECGEYPAGYSEESALGRQDQLKQCLEKMLDKPLTKEEARQIKHENCRFDGRCSPIH